MKKSLLIFSLLLFSLFSFSQGGSDPESKQKKSIFRAAAIVGFNASQIEGDALGGFMKYGLNAGGAAYVILSKKFSINFEILYNQKGSNSGANQGFNNGQTKWFSRKIILDYIDIPILVNFHDKDIAIFGVGFVIANLVRYKETRDGIEWQYKDFDNPYRTTSFEILGSVTFIIKKKVGINLRYAYSLTNIVKSDIQLPESKFKNGGQRHNFLSLRVMYFF